VRLFNYRKKLISEHPDLNRESHGTKP